MYKGFCNYSIQFFRDSRGGVAQTVLPTNSDTHIFWQADRKLKPTDFKGNFNADPRLKVYCDTFQLCTSASVGLFAVLDVPKRKKHRKEKLDKVYFVPAFEMNTSVFSFKDSIGVAMQQVVFDIYELSARIARRQFKELEDSMGVAYGIRYIFLSTVQADVKKFRDGLVNEFTHDVYINGGRESAYEEWRGIIDKWLNELKEFETTPEDCYRFVKGKPTDKAYKQSKEMMGKLFE